MPGQQPPVQQLLVEGRDDRHVVWQLCVKHRLPEQFAVVIPGQDWEGRLAPPARQAHPPTQEDEAAGITELLKDVPVRLRQPGLHTLGIMVDADEDLSRRWREVRGALARGGYASVPEQPPANGWISGSAGPVRVGVWLMPDNRASGTLEDFAARLIRDHDPLLARADSVLSEMEVAGLRRYRVAHRPKALIHTWLAWQENPGHPMGLAIKAGALRHDAPPALEFVGWLRRLFGLPGA